MKSRGSEGRPRGSRTPVLQAPQLGLRACPGRRSRGCAVVGSVGRTRQGETCSHFSWQRRPSPRELCLSRRIASGHLQFSRWDLLFQARHRSHIPHPAPPPRPPRLPPFHPQTGAPQQYLCSCCCLRGPWGVSGRLAQPVCTPSSHLWGCLRGGRNPGLRGGFARNHGAEQCGAGAGS